MIFVECLRRILKVCELREVTPIYLDLSQNMSGPYILLHLSFPVKRHAAVQKTLTRLAIWDASTIYSDGFKNQDLTARAFMDNFYKYEIVEYCATTSMEDIVRSFPAPINLQLLQCLLNF